ncbi:TPA: hypothetical protein ACNGYW_005721 [Klebsiella michiganensis]
MSTYKTGNPLGSAAVKDLFDNAENLDFALNSLTALIWTDRLGKTRRSFFGMESAFVTQLTSQESRFNTFIQSSGYQIIGDYTAGPLTLTEYNQLIRYNNELYKLTAATDIPFTTAGNTDETWTDTDAAHFVSVGDAALRQNLGSSEMPGAGIVMLGQKVTVQQAMDYLLNKGNAVRLSTYCLLSATENSAFAAALEGAKGADGYACRVIVNDTGRPVKLTERFLFQSVESTSVLGEKYNENLCGVVGEFELATGAGFDFISCYSPFINIVVTDGGGNSVDAATPLNSDFAVRMESGVIAPEFHITGYGYGGYLFGSAGEWNGETAPGVQCVHKSSLAAFGGAAALYVRGTTGFGNITSVWEEGVTHYSLIDTAYDVQIASYENFIPAAGAGQLMLRSCGSMHIGKLLTGAWGVPQVKIFDCPSVDIGTHLSVLGNSDVNTEDTYAADICGSVVHIGSSQLLKLGCGYRVGHGGSLFVDNINGNILNQAVSQTNNTSYDGLSTSTASSVTIKSARLFRGNSSLVLSSKDMFHVDATITSGKLELQSVEAIGFNYQRTSDYARLVNVLSQSANFKVYLDGVAVDYTGTTLPFYIYNYASLIKSIGLSFTGELQFSVGNSAGNGKVLEVSSGLNTGGGTTTYTGNKKLRVYIVGTISTGGSFSVVRAGKTVFLSSTAGQFAANFDVRPGDVLVVSNNNTTVSSSWAEVQFN